VVAIGFGPAKGTRWAALDLQIGSHVAHSTECARTALMRLRSRTLTVAGPLLV